MKLIYKILIYRMNKENYIEEKQDAIIDLFETELYKEIKEFYNVND